jgi:hypothetical protein
MIAETQAQASSKQTPGSTTMRLLSELPQNIYLYYKERRQLKTFLTQIGLGLPLTPDTPVIYFWKWIGYKDYEVPKNRNLENVSAKNEFFSHKCCSYPPVVPTCGPTLFLSSPHRTPPPIHAELE